MEKLHADPDVVQVYDFLNPNEMKELKAKARTLMTRSAVAVSNKAQKTFRGNTLSSGRTSSSGFFRNTFPVLENFQHKVEMFTGLSATHKVELTEDPQAVAYTSLGSHYVSHNDRVSVK